MQNKRPEKIIEEEQMSVPMPDGDDDIDLDDDIFDDDIEMTDDIDIQHIQNNNP